MPARFTRTDKNRTGNYCEALARAAFIADGANVALPVTGTQAGWDLLVEEPDGWKKVQVKSAKQLNGNGALVGLIHGGGGAGKRSRTYAVGAFDYLVAVLPETGTIWKVPGEQVLGTGLRSLGLKLESAWMNGQEKAELPTLTFERVAPLPPKVPVLRRYLRETTGNERPDFIREDTWDMLVRFRDGVTAKAIGEVYGLGLFAVRGRIEAAARAINRHGGPKAPPTVYGHQRGPVEGLRDRLLTILPTQRPEYISESTWSILVRWSEGESQRKLCKEFGTCAVGDRIWSAIKALEKRIKA